MTYKPRPWAVTSEYHVLRTIPDEFGGTLRVRTVQICWSRILSKPANLVELWIVARDKHGFRRQWLISGHQSPADLPDWLRAMALDCKPSWADTTGWPL